ncbi:MAG: hypothetical protein AAF591_13060 [Verrucomicrobiota bacterium]
MTLSAFPQSITFKDGDSVTPPLPRLDNVNRNMTGVDALTSEDEFVVPRLPKV